MVALVNASDGQMVTLKTIATKQRIPVKYLEQIFIKLHRAGLVKAQKGPGGGYQPGRSPSRITLYDIIHAVGEYTAPVMCAMGKPDPYCARTRNCPLRPYWVDLGRNIDVFFRKHTVADICKQHYKKKIKEAK